MTDFEDSGIVANDEKLKDMLSKSNQSVQDEKDASKNSNKKPNHPSKSKMIKAMPNKKFQLSQSARRSELIEKQKEIGYTYDDHTQEFLDFLVRTNVDIRDIKSKVLKNQGYTGAYTRTGYHIISHPSNLPMGNKLFHGFGACILDCIYCNNTESYYVIDLMCWDGHSYYDCIAQTRFKILQDKVLEYDLNHPSQMNPMDGLLFIYKHVTYQSGSSPFFLWLTLDRLPSKLNIEIPEMGIITAVSYKDPVTQALVHGVSPAIISQVHPTNHGRQVGVLQCTNGQNKTRNYQRSYLFSHGCLMLDHSFADLHQNHFYTVKRPNRHTQDYFTNLHEDMSDFNRYKRKQKQYSQLYGGLFYYNNLNSNNTNSISLTLNSCEGKTQIQNYCQNVNQYQQKKIKNTTFRSKHQTSNWENPHGVMKSSWMVKKPDDFECNYLVCICPVAKRRLMVAAKGYTCIFKKHGQLVDSLTCSLPNGHPRPKTAWRNDILSNVIIKSGKKEYTLEVLPKYACSKENISSALSQCHFQVDGLLFIDRRSQYSSDSGCEALWLKVDMMEGILGYSCPFDVSYKPTTDKECKERDYFLSKENI